MTPMPINRPITLIENANARQNLHRSLQVVDCNIEIFHKKINFKIAAEKSRATLADIVPTARKISTKVVLTVIENIKLNDQNVPCCKGCSKCCYYLVPLSVPEAFCMRRQILDMNHETRKALVSRWLETSSIVLQNHQLSPELSLNLTESDISRISRWYSQMKLPCPFLSENICSIYQIRPCACCEHIITDSSEVCGTDTSKEDMSVVSMPVSVLDAVTQLTAQLEQSKPETVMLSLALPWTQINLERDKRTWPAIEIVEKFADILQNMQLKHRCKLTPVHQPDY